jgi:hypothetical protein
MAMLQNPAGLVELPGNQLLVQFDTAFDHFCVQPYGYYGWGVYLTEDQQGNTNLPDDHRSEFGDPASSAYGQRPLDRVCNTGAIAPLPQFALSYHLTSKLSVAIGFVAPSFTGLAQWGGKDGTIQTSDGARPTPTRYQFIHTESSFALNPTASVAYRVLPWLSVGATLQAAMATANSYLVLALRAGTSPANDALAKLEASDYFIPSLTFAVHAKPTRYLRFAGTFNWSDGIDGHGKMTVTTNTFHQGAVGSELLPFTNDPVKLSRVRVSQPWTATLAARFAKPRDGGSDELQQNDVLVNEAWDIEFDAAFTANHTAQSQSLVNVASDFTLEFRRADGTPQMPLNVSPKDIEEISVDRHALDVLTLRLGGSLNLLPGRFQVSAGSFYQTRGVDPSYASIDNFGFQRLGLSLGALYRVGPVDLTASFSHIFQEDITVAPPPHQPRNEATNAVDSGFDQRIYENGQLSSAPKTDPRAPSPAAADGVAKVTQSALFESDVLRRRVVNAGRYTASFNVLSVGAVYHF